MIQDDFADVLRRFTTAVEAGDGAAFARLFSEDGEYHDVFYGIFKGRAAIAGMLENHFWRDGDAFRWEMLEPVTDGATGYARWRFSFTSRLEQAKGKRIFMEGVGYFYLNDGLITRYEDYARAGECLVQLGHSPARLHRIFEKMAEKQNADPDAQRHLKL
jgi:ketosteroid isomerase-like protein